MIKFVKRQIALHPKLWEIFKFLLIGGTATLIDFAIMWVIINPVNWSPVIGTGLGFCGGLVFNYIFSIAFVFSGNGNSTERAKTTSGFIFFALLATIGLAIHTLGMWVGFSILGINEWVIKVILTFVVLVYNYLSRKFLLFKKQKPVNVDIAQPES